MQGFLAVDPQGQFHSPYIGMGNNPVSYVDPDGEWVNFVIGAVAGGIGGFSIGKSLGKSGWELFAYTMAGAGIGVATSGLSALVTSSTAAALGGTGSAIAGGAAGGAFNGAAMAGLGGQDIGQGALYGGIGGAAGSTAGLLNINGIAGGAAYGAATGGLISGGLSAAQGGSFEDGFRSGAVSGGIMGGVSGYQNARSVGRNGLTGLSTEKSRANFFERNLSEINYLTDDEIHEGLGIGRARKGPSFEVGPISAGEFIDEFGRTRAEAYFQDFIPASGAIRPSYPEAFLIGGGLVRSSNIAGKAVFNSRVAGGSCKLFRKLAQEVLEGKLTES